MGSLDTSNAERPWKDRWKLPSYYQLSVWKCIIAKYNMKQSNAKKEIQIKGCFYPTPMDDILWKICKLKSAN